MKLNILTAILIFALGCNYIDSESEYNKNQQADELERICYRGQYKTAERYGDMLFIEGDIEVGNDDFICPEVVDNSKTGIIGTTTQSLRIIGIKYKWPNSTVPYVISQFDASGNCPYGSINQCSNGAAPPCDAGVALVSISACFDDPSSPPVGFPLLTGESNQVDSIERAMDDWETVTPGIKFVPYDSSKHSDYVRFQHDFTCSSHVGRDSSQNKQILRLANGCIVNWNLAGNSILSYSMQHEIGHALGLFHQHNRSDRDDFVKINWGDIKGCALNAAGPADCGVCDWNDLDGNSNIDAGERTNGCCKADGSYIAKCDRSYNFETQAQGASARADVGSYDYDSLMHYGANAFSTGPGNTIDFAVDIVGNIVPEATNPDTGALYAIGQRTHISNIDQMSINAMYPFINVANNIFFRDTGLQTLCKLTGRDRDISVKFHSYQYSYSNSYIYNHYVDFTDNEPGSPFANREPAYNYHETPVTNTKSLLNSYLNTNNLPTGEYNGISCQAKSVFWNSNYAYPNTTVSSTSSDLNWSSGVETFSTEKIKIKILDPGLIPIMFNNIL